MIAYHTYMLVLAVEVSHSPARPTMSNPVDSWLKNLGWPAIDKETTKQHNHQETIHHLIICDGKTRFVIINLACKMMRVVYCSRLCCPYRPLTCSHSIFESVPAVHKDLLQRLRLVRELQVETLHALQQLVRVVKIQHLGGSVKCLPNVVG